MKNHWIKKKEDRDAGLKHVVNHMVAFARTTVRCRNMNEDTWHHVAIQFDGTDSEVYVDGEISHIHIEGRVLDRLEVKKLYEQGTTCKCGKIFKTNVGHTEECLKQLDTECYSENIYDVEEYYK